MHRIAKQFCARRKLYQAADLTFRQRLYTELGTIPAIDAVNWRSST